MNEIDLLFERLSKSKFRSGFSLSKRDIEYIDEKGRETIRAHAREFVRKRLAPEEIPNDGKQTPWRGHPVFKAQHATACCCRGCLNKWHGIRPKKELSEKEQDYIVEIIMRWINEQKNRFENNKKNEGIINKSKGQGEEYRQLSIFDIDKNISGRESFLKLKEHKAAVFGYEEAKEFAVIIPLVFKNDKAELLFEVRSSSLKDQPKDICFPGGRIEEGESPMEAALREISEELLISEGDIEIIGTGDVLYSGSSIIHTFPAELKNYEGAFNEEVDEVFTLPFEYFAKAEPEKYYIKRKAVPDEDFPYDKIQGGKDYKWREFKTPVFFYGFKDRNIWGITASIIRNFVETVR